MRVIIGGSGDILDDTASWAVEQHPTMEKDYALYAYVPGGRIALFPHDPWEALQQITDHRRKGQSECIIE